MAIVHELYLIYMWICHSHEIGREGNIFSIQTLTGFFDSEDTRGDWQCI